jgi:site-specific DNA-methyltransferase (cytosine-N4-specific)
MVNYSIMDTENTYTHSFHPYAAKFPPYAVRSLIQKYTNVSDNVLDPFCGSGTTLVECRMLCRNATGIELNPIGKLISETKSARYTKEDIDLALNAIFQLKEHCLTVNQWITSFPLDEILPNHPNKDFWFKPHVLRELRAIKSIIDQYAYDTKVHNLLMTGFSRIIVPVSNQESETRYKAIDKNLPLGYTLRFYIKVIEGYVELLKKYEFDNSTCKIRIEVIEGDAREKISCFEPDTFDFVITSPPYINSYDYYLYHKHRIYWLEKDPRTVRRLELGGHHTVDRQTYEKATNDYRDSMLKVFKGTNRALKLGKYFALLIGDGIVKGKTVKANELVEESAKLSGFEQISTISIPLREVSRSFIKGTKGHQKLHHVIVLHKSHELE